MKTKTRPESETHRAAHPARRMPASTTRSVPRTTAPAERALARRHTSPHQFAHLGVRPDHAATPLAPNLNAALFRSPFTRPPVSVAEPTVSRFGLKKAFKKVGGAFSKGLGEIGDFAGSPFGKLLIGGGLTLATGGLGAGMLGGIGGASGLLGGGGLGGILGGMGSFLGNPLGMLGGLLGPMGQMGGSMLGSAFGFPTMGNPLQGILGGLMGPQPGMMGGGMGGMGGGAALPGFAGPMTLGGGGGSDTGGGGGLLGGLLSPMMNWMRPAERPSPLGAIGGLLGF